MNFYRKSNIFSKEELVKIEYALNSIFNDMSKFLIYLGVAAVINAVPVFLAVTIPFMSIRIFIGGIHMSTYNKCFVFSMVIICGMIIVSHLLITEVKVVMCMSIMSMSLIAILGPKASTKKRKQSKRIRNLFKFYAVLLEIVFLSIAHFGIGSLVCKIGIYVSLYCANIQLLILRLKGTINNERKNN